MATILTFEPPAGRPPSSRPPPASPAAVVIFPGIRYERMAADRSKPARRPGRRTKSEKA